MDLQQRIQALFALYDRFAETAQAWRQSAVCRPGCADCCISVGRVDITTLEGIYADWCIVERERLREQYLAALGALAGLYAEQGDLLRAVDLYQRLLSHDPYQEAVHRAVMGCYCRLGDRPAAIRQYHTCVRVLRAELGLNPAPETEQLYRQITGGA